jgi:hypothetical protein
MRVAVKVLVVAMSAPASKYASWISATTLRARQVEQIRIALDVTGGREPLAAVLLLGEPARWMSPRPVEHEDPLGEECSRLCAVSFTNSAPA